MDNEAFLKLSTRVKLLAGLGPAELESLLACCRRVSVTGGQAVVREGDVGETMFILLAGEASVWQHYDSTSSRRRLSKILAGESFGEMAFLNGGARSATIVADHPCIILEVKREALKSEVAAKLYRNIARMLSYRLAEANEIMSLVKESPEDQFMSTGIFKSVKQMVSKKD
jgi:CRP-like cAMP-binding protein